MLRREFITGLVATAGWPFDVRAQQAPLHVGFLPLGSPDNAYDRSLVELFRQGLRDGRIKCTIRWWNLTCIRPIAACECR
jgi:hypothetical protein